MEQKGEERKRRRKGRRWKREEERRWKRERIERGGEKGRGDM